MKKLFLFIAFASLFISKNITAQCTSCNIIISGMDAANHIIVPGDTFCITSTGTCTGLLTVAGGTLCNQGHIGSSKVRVTGTGSIFTNYGTINSSNILVDSGGSFNNTYTAIAIIDSLIIKNNHSNFVNAGSLKSIRLAVVDSSSLDNGGNLTCDFLSDSLSSINNITGCMTINYDFYNAYNSYYILDNAGCLYVGRDWYNSTGSTFRYLFSNVTVVRDWYNSALIISSSGCNGGFSIGGYSSNTGTIGQTAGEILDICDAGHPAGGLDLNTGTIISTVVYCQCIQSCALSCSTTVNIQETSHPAATITLSPNPATTTVTISISSFTANRQLIITDVLGREIERVTITNNQSTINVTQWNNGVYFYQLIDDKETKAGKFVVSH